MLYLYYNEDFIYVACYTKPHFYHFASVASTEGIAIDNTVAIANTSVPCS